MKCLVFAMRFDSKVHAEAKLIAIKHLRFTCKPRRIDL